MCVCCFGTCNISSLVSLAGGAGLPGWVRSTFSLCIMIAIVVHGGLSTEPCAFADDATFTLLQDSRRRYSRPSEWYATRIPQFQIREPAHCLVVWILCTRAPCMPRASKCIRMHASANSHGHAPMRCHGQVVCANAIKPRTESLQTSVFHWCIPTTSFSSDCDSTDVMTPTQVHMPTPSATRTGL